MAFAKTCIHIFADGEDLRSKMLRVREIRSRATARPPSKAWAIRTLENYIQRWGVLSPHQHSISINEDSNKFTFTLQSEGKIKKFVQDLFSRLLIDRRQFFCPANAGASLSKGFDFRYPISCYAPSKL